MAVKRVGDLFSAYLKVISYAFDRSHKNKRITHKIVAVNQGIPDFRVRETLIFAFEKP